MTIAKKEQSKTDTCNFEEKKLFTPILTYPTK